MADQEVKKHPDLDLLHQQLLKDQYAVPEDYAIFEKTFKDTSNASLLHKQLLEDNYAIPSDYNEFLYTFGLKKKEAGDYGLPSAKVFEDMFAQVRKGKATEPEVEEGFPETVSKPEDVEEDSDLLTTQKEKDRYTGKDIFKSTLQFSIGNYLTEQRFDHLKKPELKIEEPKAGFKEQRIGQKVISETLGEDYFKTKTEAELAEIDKKLAALPAEQQSVGTILPTAGPFISKPIVSEERAALLKEKDRLNMLLKTPSKLTYILGRAYNQTITGLADNIINGESRAPEEWLSKYDSDTMTDVTAMVLGFLLDMPAFGLGGKLGTTITKKAAAPFVKKIMENSTKKMIKVGIPERLAGEFALKAAERTTIALQGMGSSSAALGSYSAITDALGQWAVPDASFDDIRLSQVFKHGMESSVLGLGVGGFGIGASMLAQKASMIPNAIGRLGAKGAIGIGGLTAESALFAGGGALLEGRPATKDDFISTAAMLAMLKLSHKVGRIPSAIEDPKKAAMNFYKSVAYNPNKAGEGIFAVDLVPYEIESVGGKDYKTLVRKLAHDDAYLGMILQNENIPARLKQKLLWASRGTAMEDINLYGDKITQNGVYVDMVNKEGVLVERKKFGTPEEAESFAIRNQAQLNDMKIQEKAASLPIEEKTKIIEKLKEEGFDDALLVSALEKNVNERTPEENKLVAKYYSFIPKGDIKPEDVIKEEIPDVIVVDPGKEGVVEKPEVKAETPEIKEEKPSEPEKPIEPKKVETPEEKAIRINDRIAGLVSEYNAKGTTKSRQGEIRSHIRRLMGESEKDKYSIGMEGKKLVVKKNGSKVRKTAVRGDNKKLADIPEGEFKTFLDMMLEARVYLYDLDLPGDVKTRDKAIDDILKGNANVDTQAVIDGLENMFKRGVLNLKPGKEIGRPIKIKDVMEEIANEKVVAFAKDYGDLTLDNIDKAVEYGIIDKNDVERVKKILKDEDAERERIESERADEEREAVSELDKAGDEAGKDQGKSVPEEKPVKSEIKATPEQQAQIDKINKEYDKKIADKQEELKLIPKKIQDAIDKANKERVGLFGDNKPVDPDEIIKREEQGFDLEGAVERIRKPFEERAAQLQREIDDLNSERKGKIEEVLTQGDLFAAAPEKPEIVSDRESFPEYQPNTRTPVTQKLLDMVADVMGVEKYTDSLDSGKYISWLQGGGELGYKVSELLNKPREAYDLIEKYRSDIEKAKSVTPKVEKELPELRSPEVADYDSNQDVDLINRALDRGDKVFKTFYRKKGEEKWRRAYLTSSPDLTEAKARESARRQLLADAEGIPIGRENEALSRYEFKAEEVLPEERKPEMPEVRPTEPDIVTKYVNEMSQKALERAIEDGQKRGIKYSAEDIEKAKAKSIEVNTKHFTALKKEIDAKNLKALQDRNFYNNKNWKNFFEEYTGVKLGKLQRDINANLKKFTEGGVEAPKEKFVPEEIPGYVKYEDYLNSIKEKTKIAVSDWDRNKMISDAIYGLSGDSNKKYRQGLMSFLKGEKVPVAESGIHAIMKEVNKWLTEQKPEIKEVRAEKAPEGAKEYKYRLTSRPFDIGTYPKEGFVRAELEPGERFETLTYGRKLTAQERGHYDLLPLTEISDIKGKLFEDKDGEFFVDLEWKANNIGADVSMFDTKNQLIEKPFFMSTKDILENIEKGYWKEKPDVPPSKPEGLPQRKEALGTRASKNRRWRDKNDRAGNTIKTETKQDAEAIGFGDQLPLSTKEDPAYGGSDLNNSMTLSQISRNLINNLKRKPGGGVRSGMIKRFLKNAAGVFFPDSGIVRIKGLKDFRVLSHELGHWLDFQIFDFRNVVGAKNLPEKYADVAAEIRSVGVKYKGRIYRDFDKIDRDAKEIDKKTNLPRISVIKANELKTKLQPQLAAREKRLAQLRAKYGDNIVAGVLQRDYFKKELADFLMDINYPVSARSKTEAIAEFTWNYIADSKKVETELPKFHAWFEKMLDAAPPIKEALETARKEFKDYADLDPRARRYIENEKKDPWFEGLIKSWDPDKFLYSYVNHLQYMKNLSEEWKKVVGSNAVMFKDPYASAKAMMGIDGRAQQWLLYHPYFKRGKDIEIRTDIEGLMSVLKTHKLFQGSKKYGDYSDYLLAKDSLESYQNRKPEQAVMPIADAKAKIDLYEKQYGVRELWDFQSKVQKYNEALLDFYAESGKISREVIEKIKKEHQYYVPLRRVFEEFEKSKGMAGTGKDVLATSEKGMWKRLGSERQVRDIFSSMIENTYNILSAAEHNIHNRNVRDALFDIQNYGLKESKGDKFLLKEDKSLIQFIENNNVIKPAFDVKTGEMTWIMEHKAPKGKILSVWEEGKIKYYDVDAETYNNLFQNEPKVSHLIRIMSMPSRWLQAGAVVFDPTFPVRNVGRDQISAWFYSKHGYSPVDFVKGIFSSIKKDDMFQKWMASGADQSFLTASDKLLEEKYAERKVGRPLNRKWKTYSRNPLLALQDFSRMSEMGTRVGAFKNAYKKTGDVYAAAIESRDISADYGIHGAAMRSILPLYPFLNARLQHTRMMTEAVGRDPKKFFLKGLAITAPAIVNWLANNWDEEATERYQSLPEWRRIGMFNIRIPGTDNYFPLPKGFLGMVFASTVESALDFAAKDDPRTAQSLARELFKDFSPISNVSELIPFIVRPKVEMVMNKKAYTGKPIIPETLAMLKPEEQYFESTPEILKSIGNAVGASPLKMEHYIKSYFGGAGIGAVRITDEILQELGLVESKPDDLFTTLSRMPFTKAFVTETPIGPYSSYVSDFYSKLDEMEKLNRSFNNHVIKEDFERLEKLMAEPENEDLFSFYEGNKTAINKFRQTMSGIRDLKIANLKNDMMTNVEARKENDRLDLIIHETAIRFRDSWEEFKDGGKGYFDFSKEMDDVIKNLKVDKAEVTESLKQQKLLYNPYWLMLREKDEKVWGLLKEFGGFKEIKQTRTISRGAEKIELSLQQARIFNEKLTEEYGRAVKSLVGTDPRSYKSKSENMQPGTDKTQLEHLYGVAWDQAMDRVVGTFKIE